MYNASLGPARPASTRYFFLPEPKAGGHPPVFWLGAAAIVLIFSFLGFLASRLPFCSPLAIAISLARFEDDAVVDEVPFQDRAPFFTE